MRVAVTGATGLIGGELVPELHAAGHEVVVVSRRTPEMVRERFAELDAASSTGGAAGDSDTEASARPAGAPVAGVARWDPSAGRIDAAVLEGIDAAVHLAGESIMGLWTRRKKERIRRSRIEGTRLFSETLAALDPPPTTLVSASGINVYGDRPFDEPVDERSRRGDGFFADLGREWEAATAPASEAGIRVVHTRFGLVLTPRGGLLQVMLPLFRLGLGGRIGDPERPWSWVAIDDVVGAMMHALGSPASPLAGPVNVVSPNSVTHAEFVDTLARVLRRPAIFRVPAFLPRLVLDRDQADETILHGLRVVPRKLRQTGYRFRFATLEPALRHLLDRE